MKELKGKLIKEALLGDLFSDPIKRTLLTSSLGGLYGAYHGYNNDMDEAKENDKRERSIVDAIRGTILGAGVGLAPEVIF